MDRTTIKGIATLQLVAVAVAMVTIASTPRAAGYEISIYAAYPWHTWVLLAGAILTPVVVSLVRWGIGGSGGSRGDREDRDAGVGPTHLWALWLPALLALLILFWLPLFRGYVAYGREDTLTHLGRINDILWTGKISENNGYPLFHLLSATLHFATGVGAKTVITALPGFFILLYLGWVGRVAEEVFESRLPILLAVALGLGFAFEPVQLFTPFNGSLFTLPFFVALYYRSRERTGASYSVLVILTVVMLPFVHVFTLAALIFVVGTILVVDTLFDALRSRSRFFGGDEGLDKPTTVPILSLMLLWMGFWGIEQYVSRISWLLYFIVGSLLKIQAEAPWAGSSPVGRAASMLGQANLSLFEYLYAFWARRGILLYFVLSPIVLFTGLLLPFRSDDLSPNRRVAHFLATYCVFGFLSAVLLFSSYIFSYARVVRVIALASIVLNVYAISQLLAYLSDSHRAIARKAFTVAVTLAVCGLVLTSLFTLHMSPIGLEDNSQVTASEFESASWWFEFHPPASTDFGLLTTTYVPRRLNHALTGRQSQPAVQTYQGSYIPDAFGYENNTTISQSVPSAERNESAYMIFSTVDQLNHKKLFRSVWPDTYRYQPRYVRELHRDSTADKLYVNGEVSIWQISIQNRTNATDAANTTTTATNAINDPTTRATLGFSPTP